MRRMMCGTAAPSRIPFDKTGGRNMKRGFLRYVGLAAAVVVAAGLVITAPAEAQNYAGGTPSTSAPRTPEGKPDLSGTWNGRRPCATTPCHTIVEPGQKLENGDYSQRFESRRCAPTQKGTDGVGCFEETNETADLEFTGRLNANRPIYKPEYWDKVQD